MAGTVPVEYVIKRTHRNPQNEFFFVAQLRIEIDEIHSGISSHANLLVALEL